MTSIESWAVGLFAAGAVFAIFGPGIAAVRIGRKHREAKAFKGTIADFNQSMTPSVARASALRDATWGIVEFGFVALGVVLAAVASIILVYGG